MEPGQLTTLYHYLPPGLRYATSMGPVRDPGVIDWRDVVDRLERADVRRNVTELVDAVPVGGHVVVATPNFIRETRPHPLLRAREPQRPGAHRTRSPTIPGWRSCSSCRRAGTYPVGASAHVRVFERTR